MQTTSKKNILWMDLEMTGLDEKKDHILEIAAVITNMDFETISTFHQVVYQSHEVLANMNDWCKQHHGASGLTREVSNGKPLEETEKALIEWLTPFFKKDDRIVLTGNSIGNDRRFIDQYMKLFAEKLHYRMIDVSSFKEIFREKYGIKFDKANTHRATQDIHESIRELKHYLNFVNLEGQK